MFRLMLVALVSLALAALPTQAADEIVKYFDIEGVWLDMSEAEAVDALQDLGYERRGSALLFEKTNDERSRWQVSIKVETIGKNTGKLTRVEFKEEHLRNSINVQSALDNLTGFMGQPDECATKMTPEVMSRFGFKCYFYDAKPNSTVELEAWVDPRIRQMTLRRLQSLKRPGTTPRDIR